MTPEEYTCIICDVIDGKLDAYRFAIQYAKTNADSILANVIGFPVPGKVEHDAIFRMAVRSLIIAGYEHGLPAGYFNIALPRPQARAVAQVFAAYSAFLDRPPYFATAESLIQRQLMAWGDKETSLPVDAPMIVLYDGDDPLTEYAGGRALQEFVKKINPSEQALVYVTDIGIDEIPPVTNGTNHVWFNDLGFYITDFPGIIKETEEREAWSK